MVKVLKAGFYSTIQDLGRMDYQEFGVPYSGAMDQHAASLANTLIGNKADAAVIEMTMVGATFQFKCDTLICLSGANMNPKLNEGSVSNNKAIVVKKGEILSFGKLERGFRCYLGVFGGFKTEIVMGSRSMYRNITQAISLQKGDDLEINSNTFLDSKPYSHLRLNTSYLEKLIIDVYKGSEFDLLSKEQKKQLFDSAFSVSNLNNRMAYQLNEPVNNHLEPIITSPVLPGTIQLTPFGTLIILMRDCQTTGGYPRVLQLKPSAINVLAQKYTGQEIRFKLV